MAARSSSVSLTSNTCTRRIVTSSRLTGTELSLGARSAVLGVLEVEAAAGVPLRALVAVGGEAAGPLQHRPQVRSSSTATPCCSMIERLRSIRPWVWLRSGDRLRVQLMYSARRSSKRHSPAPVPVGSVIKPPGVGKSAGAEVPQQLLGVVVLPALVRAALGVLLVQPH